MNYSILSTENQLFSSLFYVLCVQLCTIFLAQIINFETTSKQDLNNSIIIYKQLFNYFKTGLVTKPAHGFSPSSKRQLRGCFRFVQSHIITTQYNKPDDIM